MHRRKGCRSVFVLNLHTSACQVTENVTLCFGIQSPQIIQVQTFGLWQGFRRHIQSQAIPDKNNF